MAVSASKSPDSQKQGSEKTTTDKQSGGTATFQFIDNRAESLRHVQMQEAANHANQQPIQQIASGKPVQLAKDAALWSAGDKVDGKTSTKVIMTKGGTKGIFRFPMNGDIIDTFIGQNIADESDKPSAHSDAKKIDIPVAVSDHDLAATYKSTAPGLSSSEISGGGRPKHFKHGDDSHGVDRSNKYTWHHKNKLGKMELIDMNVHGAMWHYGGISGWKESEHDKSVDTDDDPTA